MAAPYGSGRDMRVASSSEGIGAVTTAGSTMIIVGTATAIAISIGTGTVTVTEIVIATAVKSRLI